MAHGGRWDPPNFATASADNLNKSSWDGRRFLGSKSKNTGYTGVTLVNNTETEFVDTSANASAMLITSHSTAGIPGDAGVVRFQDNTELPLAVLKRGEWYDFNIKAVSASNNASVYVFRK